MLHLSHGSDARKAKSTIRDTFFYLFIFFKHFVPFALRSSVQKWAESFGKEIASLAAKYSGAELLQKVRRQSKTLKKKMFFYHRNFFFLLAFPTA